MTSPDLSVRGAGRYRGGATDTTMLIWKVIEASPGIDRAGIWAKVEHGIPEGYALRRHAAFLAQKGKLVARDPATNLSRARGFVLTETLSNLRDAGSVKWDGDDSTRRYTVARELRYKGNPDAVDIDGSKMTDHMAIANGLRVLDRLLGRQNIGDKDKAALAALANALRAKGGTNLNALGSLR